MTIESCNYVLSDYDDEWECKKPSVIWFENSTVCVFGRCIDHAEQTRKFYARIQSDLTELTREEALVALVLEE